jgi:hypothetical protein
VNKSEKLSKMQPSAGTTGIEAIQKAGKSVVSAFHVGLNCKYLKIRSLWINILAFHSNAPQFNPLQTIDYKHSAGLLSGRGAVRNISAIAGG